MPKCSSEFSVILPCAYNYAKNILDGSKRPHCPFCFSWTKKTRESVGRRLILKNIGVEWSYERAVPWMPFFHFPDGIKAQKDSNSLLLLNHVPLTAQSLNTNKWLERKALKSSAVVPEGIWSQSSQEQNIRSLNRSLAKQHLGCWFPALVLTFTAPPKCKSAASVRRC